MADNLTDVSVDALAERLEAYNAAYRRSATGSRRSR